MPFRPRGERSPLPRVVRALRRSSSRHATPDKAVGWDGAMATSHVVRPGEYLTSIAKHYSHRRWPTIYYHPDNAEFRRRRPNPNVVLPGDRIVIPDRDQREEPCATDRRHRFVLERPVVQLRIVVRDDRARPLGNEP